MSSKSLAEKSKTIIDKRLVAIKEGGITTGQGKSLAGIATTPLKSPNNRD